VPVCYVPFLTHSFYLYTGSFDSAVSISEEATNAATAVPWAIVGAIASATISGFAILVILALTMG
jgi:amino acid transporter